MAVEETTQVLADLVGESGALFHDKKHRAIDLPAASAPLADTHGHLTVFRKMDPARALARAALAGVRLLVVPLDPTEDATDAPARLAWLDEQLERAAEQLELAKRHGLTPPRPSGYEELPDLLDNVRIVCGVHPYGAADFLGRGKQGPAFGEAAHEALAELLAHPRCVGVGEIGIDFGPWNELPEDVQVEAFVEQLRLVHAQEMPVELHIRDAQDDPSAHAHQLAAEILGDEGVPQVGCDLHCFTSGPEVLDPFVRLGCHIAFGGAATFARSEEIRAAAALCPSSRILSETDSPYMAPAPLRGRECEPAMVAFSAACVARTRAESGVATVDETYRMLWDNACTLFVRR